MSSLSDTQIAQLCNFDAARITAFKADLLFNGNVDGVSASGACALDRLTTELTISATKAYTLAAPTYAGQRKVIRCVSAASTPLGTLTITSPDTTSGFACASTFVFDTAGQEITLEATPGLLWRCIHKKRAGGTANNVVVGTTDLAGFSLWTAYFLSVTATVNSTGTKGIPNGSVIGERCTVLCSTAASTPIGSIDGVFAGMEGVAYTHLGAIGVAGSTTVTGDFAELVWNGLKWQVVNQSGCTLS
jgi:hypothetical protein